MIGSSCACQFYRQSRSRLGPSRLCACASARIRSPGPTQFETCYICTDFSVVKFGVSWRSCDDFDASTTLRRRTAVSSWTRRWLRHRRNRAGNRAKLRRRSLESGFTTGFLRRKKITRSEERGVRANIDPDFLALLERRVAMKLIADEVVIKNLIRYPLDKLKFSTRDLLEEEWSVFQTANDWFENTIDLTTWQRDDIDHKSIHEILMRKSSDLWMDNWDNLNKKKNRDLREYYIWDRCHEYDTLYR